MTLSKAMPVLGLCVLFDGLRSFFVWFWLLGPAIAAGYCTTQVGGVAGAACTAGVAAVGFYGSAALVMFGSGMAMAIGLIGWLIISGIVVSTNFRLLKENASTAAMSVVGLGISVVPFIGSLPALTGTTWHLYHTQIKHDKKKLRAWKQEHDALAQQDKQQRIQELMQARAYAEQKQAQEQAQMEEEFSGEEIPA